MNQRFPDESKSPQFSTQYAPSTHFQRSQFSLHLQYLSSSAQSTEQAGEGHFGMHAALEMEDSMYACTSKSGFFPFLAVLCTIYYQRVVPISCVWPVFVHTHSATAARSRTCTRCQRAEKVTAAGFD